MPLLTAPSTDDDITITTALLSKTTLSPSEPTDATSINTTTTDPTPIPPNLPTNWPPEITFLHDHTYSPTITPDTLAALGRTTAESSTYPRIPSSQLLSPCPRTSVQHITNPTHPAHGQRGLFASQDLIPDTFICLYLGHVHTNSMSDTDPHSDYDLSLDRDLGLSVDAARSGNEARFANDYRGVAERPNAEFRDCMVKVECGKRKGGMKWERRVGIFVLSAGKVKGSRRMKGVRAGEEVLISYGKGYWEMRKRVAGRRGDEEMRAAAERALEGE